MGRPVRGRRGHAPTLGPGGQAESSTSVVDSCLMRRFAGSVGLVGRITTRRPVLRISLGDGADRRADPLAVEEPLEIRIAGAPLAVTMRTPGHDVELAVGFLVSEGIIGDAADFRTAIHCGGPGTGGQDGNTSNVLDVSLGGGPRIT